MKYCILHIVLCQDVLWLLVEQRFQDVQNSFRFAILLKLRHFLHFACCLKCSNSTPFPGKRGLIQWSGMRNCHLLWHPRHKYWLLQKCYISCSPPAVCTSRITFWQLWPFPNPNPSCLCQSGVQESQLLCRPAAAAGGTMCEPPQPPGAFHFNLNALQRLSEGLR